MRASIVAALLGTACCCTLVLYSRDAAAEYADLSASKEATAELAMATSEIHRYDTGLRLSPSRQHVLSSPARKTVLWNAAENDEVHVDQNGHLSVDLCVCPPFSQQSISVMGPDAAVCDHVLT